MVHGAWCIYAMHDANQPSFEMLHASDTSNWACFSIREHASCMAMGQVMAFEIDAHVCMPMGMQMGMPTGSLCFSMQFARGAVLFMLYEWWLLTNFWTCLMHCNETDSVPG